MTTATHYDARDLFDQVLSNMLHPRGDVCRPQARGQEVRSIRLDVREVEGAYLVQAELPGVQKDDIQIDIEGKQLAISAQVGAKAAVQPAQPTEEGATQPQAPVARKLLIERFQGKLSRRLQMPEEVDAEAVQANFADGVLELTLPKLKQRNAKRITL